MQIQSALFEAPTPELGPAATNDELRRVSGIAYAGGPLFLPGVGRNIVLDLATMSLPESCPLLEGHDRTRRIGRVRLAATKTDLRADGHLLTNPIAAALVKDADEGFPWQMSVHAESSHVEDVPAGLPVRINGRDLTGPLAIWRNVRIRELSLTPTGVDAETSAAILSSSVLLARPALPEEMIMPERDQETPTSPSPSAELAALSAELAAMTARAEAAEAALAEYRRQARLSDVRGVFAQLGLQHDEESALEPWLTLSDEHWGVARAQLLSSRMELPSSLFTEIAPDGESAPRDAAFSAPSGYGVDPVALAVHERAKRYQADHPDIDYLSAVRAVTK